MKIFRNAFCIFILMSTTFCQSTYTAINDKQSFEDRDLDLRDRLRHQGRRDRHRNEKRIQRHTGRSDKWLKYLER